MHDNRQWQDITLNGNFANPQEVDVKFLNDTYGGSHATDVNLYVGSITVNGHTYAGTSGTDNAAGTFASMDPNAAVMVWNGTTSFNTAGAGSTTPGAGSTTPAATPTPAPAPAPTPAPVPAPAPAASDAGTVTVHVSGDHWAGHAGGDPQFVVLVDGQQIGGVQTVSAVHDNGQWQDITLNGNFANPQEVDVKFLNDTYGGSHATDVNLYVGSITVNGHTYAGTSGTDNAAGTFASMDPNAAVMVWNGTTSFNTARERAAPRPVQAAPRPLRRRRFSRQASAMGPDMTSSSLTRRHRRGRRSPISAPARTFSTWHPC